MFEKIAVFTTKNVQPLNKPVLSDYVVDQDIGISIEASGLLERFASKTAEFETDGDNSDFDLKAEIEKHPKSLFVKCFAIKADEMNDNGDYFSVEQLKKATSTFVGVPVFTNHQNTDAEAARGKVVHSWWDNEQNGISIIARVDSEAYPQLARGIKEEYIVGTSMGCQVLYSICSICHNKAETPDQYCEHIRERKTRQITSKKQKCAYHKRGDEEICPICESTKKDVKTFEVDKKAFEYNYGIKFIENSFVVNPACSNCGVTEIIDPKIFAEKVAAIRERLPALAKAAANANILCDNNKCQKLAGQQEIESLNQALDLLTSVSSSMLSQKDQLDLEFLSDLVDVLSNLQTVTDELTQQGYGRLPSPSEPGTPEEQTTQGDQVTNAVGGAQTPVNPTPGGGSKVQTGDTGAGTVTGPLANKNTIELKKWSKNLLANTKKLSLNYGKVDAKSLNLPFQIPSGNRSISHKFCI